MSPLHRILHDRLTAALDGRLTFAEVMELALYHPQHGYYGPGPRRLGRGGDFFTAVSTGPLYGRLLAALARQVWQEMGTPGGFTVIEQGAHDGQLAEDVLGAQSELPYVIVEPNAACEKVQQEKLAAFAGRVRWVQSLADLPACPALFLCNELPDAMPVHRVRWDGREWGELYVVENAGAFQFVSRPLSCERLAHEVARLPCDLVAGYTTEIGLASLDWMSALATAPFHGTIYIADYGFDEAELYDPGRSTGTLRRYHAHQTDDRVLEELGGCDLTAHVNYTRLIETAEAGGMTRRAYEHQGRFIGRLGLPWLGSLDGRAPDAATQALLRQYQSLTHPAFLGRSFRVLMLDKPA